MAAAQARTGGQGAAAEAGQTVVEQQGDVGAALELRRVGAGGAIAGLAQIAAGHGHERFHQPHVLQRQGGLCGGLIGEETLQGGQPAARRQVFAVDPLPGHLLETAAAVCRGAGRAHRQARLRQPQHTVLQRRDAAVAAVVVPMPRPVGALAGSGVL
ncbi:MAG: hypothetical protein MUD04_05815 [Cyanobium sp. Prado107]|nr:hypothetical protein [Cyanobium sp. Prado107]